jgi:hypothetical protein
MSQYTEQQIREMIRGKDTLQKLVESYFWERFRADPDWRRPDDCDEDEDVGDSPAGRWIARPRLDQVTINNEQVTIACSAPACHRGCCGRDTRTYKFPTSYLWLDQDAILADLKAKADVAKAARDAALAAEAAREAQEQEAQEQEARELAQYARLQTKYGKPGVAT